MHLREDDECEPLTGHFAAVGRDARAEPQSYRAAAHALCDMMPSDVIGLVHDAGLTERGTDGAFVAARWGSMRATGADPAPNLLVVHVDAFDVDSTKDRFLLEGDPHRVIEGAIIAAYACRAREIQVFFPRSASAAAAAFRDAVDAAHAAEHIGKDTLGSGLETTVRIHVDQHDALFYRQEAALLRALPSQPGTHAIAVHSVETVCNLPHIVSRGPQWFRGLGTRDEGGTKIYGVSGRVSRCGLWELPMGTPLRELLFEHAGGMQGELRVRGVLPGGAGTAFIPADDLDIPLDVAGVAAAGSRLGSGCVLVLDDATCPVRVCAGFERLLTRGTGETPPLEGLEWISRTLDLLESGHGGLADLERLKRHADTAQATAALRSAVNHFAAHFEAHVRDHACPFRGPI
jgi:NADH-quinone oxidoreductase subunit F